MIKIVSSVDTPSDYQLIFIELLRDFTKQFGNFSARDFPFILLYILYLFTYV